MNTPPINTSASSPFWPSEQYSEVLSLLQKSLSHKKSFIVITGGEGVGKTTIVHRFLDSFEVGSLSLVLSGAQSNEIDLYNSVAKGFGIDKLFTSKIQFLIEFSNFLYKCNEAQLHVVLVFDDCQLLSQELLEIIRQIGNIEKDGVHPLRLLLVGDSSFRQVLESPLNKALRLSLALQYHLNPFPLKETAKYITHRLESVGCLGTVFCLKGIELVHRASQGCVQKINILCEHVLAKTALQGETAVELSAIYESIEQLGFTGFERENPTYVDNSECQAEDEKSILQQQYDPQLSSNFAAVSGYQREAVVSNKEEPAPKEEEYAVPAPQKKNKKLLWSAFILCSLAVPLLWWGNENRKQPLAENSTPVVVEEKQPVAEDKPIAAKIEQEHILSSASPDAMAAEPRAESLPAAVQHAKEEADAPTVVDMENREEKAVGELGQSRIVGSTPHFEGAPEVAENKKPLEVVVLPEVVTPPLVDKIIDTDIEAEKQQVAPEATVVQEVLPLTMPMDAAPHPDVVQGNSGATVMPVIAGEVRGKEVIDEAAVTKAEPIFKPIQQVGSVVPIKTIELAQPEGTTVVPSNESTVSERVKGGGTAIEPALVAVEKQPAAESKKIAIPELTEVSKRKPTVNQISAEGDLSVLKGQVKIVNESAFPEERSSVITLRLEPDAAELTTGAQKQFLSFVELAANKPDLPVFVRGYVSSDSDTDENRELSRKRAALVEQHLIKAGVATERIKVIGMGIQNPIASNSTPAGRYQNRRVEVELGTDILLKEEKNE